MDDHLEGEGEELRLFRALLGNLYLFKQTSVLIFLHNIPQMKGKNKRYC